MAIESKEKIEMSDYAGIKPAWCPGCGDFGILTAVKKALVDLNIAPYQVLMVSGIGQAGKLPQYTQDNMLNTLHGRAIPAAIAAKIANPELYVFAVGGDGDGYSEGGNHFMHAVRRNNSITYIVHDNQVYGLTKGQASPTSDWGFITKTSPFGVIAEPVHPLVLAIALGANFVARGFAGDANYLAEIIKQAIPRKGFSLIDILQPCVSFNYENTYDWYRKRVYKLDDEKDYDPTNKLMAIEKAMEWGDKIPTGVVFKQDRQSYEELLPALAKGPLVKQPRTEPAELRKLVTEFSRIEIAPVG
jgi:2-oxoglutarate/2-oxoacid ferredoxin oxidoreductase subunit beta